MRAGGQRAKGRAFEQFIARDLREAFPEFADEIARSIQSRGAEASDVIALRSVWIECQHANRGKYNPLAKLEQAERDCPEDQIPVAVTRLHGAPVDKIQVTLRAGNLIRLITAATYGEDALGRSVAYTLACACNTSPVTLPWADFKKLLRAAAVWSEEFRRGYLT